MNRVLAAMLAAAALLLATGCGTDQPALDSVCVASHQEQQDVWVPMTPGGMWDTQDVTVCDEWETP